ncbi:Osmotic avoidance abnormal protein 3 [Halotydeus destructor]|nr:Osmotic avoidance abnormal protein 3 [Halotydeus destructor]
MTSESVKVIVRCRPLNKREKDLKCQVIVNMDSQIGQCSITNPCDISAPGKAFAFDGAYYVDSTTEQMYNEIVFPLVESVTEGYNGTVFAYGQTGCGKSFSMQGVSSPASQRGIIPRAFEHIFEAISTSEKSKFLVHASYLEIYNEEIRDLLEAPESGVYVSGLSMHPVHNVTQCEGIMEQGWKNRAVGATLMNADSSRSHSIFTVYLERIDTDMDADNNIRKGKLNLVDLAGSERQAKTGATGDRLKEATKINLSLSALGNVISALVDGKSKHIPYRDSKLTRLLQDSLGGNTKTLMVACLSPADNNYDETLSTLRYANRAKNIKNKPKVNEDPKDALLREYQEEINRLKSMVEGTGQGGHVGDIDKRLSSIDEEEMNRMKDEYDKQMQDLINKFKEEQESNAKLKEEMTTIKETYEQQLQAKKQAEAIERLAALQDIMVGGEKADDSELKEKRAKRKIIAEKKINAISEALQKFDDDDQLLLKAYGDITEELRAKTVLLKKAKKKIASLEREISDLQSEFEQDRTDYLETIRKQDEQVKLLAQIMEKMQPCIRRDCNYANLERIKADCVWDEDGQRWRLPELVVTRTKLPPASGNILAGGRTSVTGIVKAFGDNMADSQLIEPIEEQLLEPSLDSSLNGDRFLEKLEKGAQENLAANYFKPKRREQLLNHVQKVTNAIKFSNLVSNSIKAHDGQQSVNNGNIEANSVRHHNLINSSLSTSGSTPQLFQPRSDFLINANAHNNQQPPLTTICSKSLPSTSSNHKSGPGSGGSISSSGSLSPFHDRELRKPVRLEAINGKRK